MEPKLRYVKEMVIGRQIHFFDYCGWKNFEIRLKILIFKDRLGILLEMRFSGVAEQEYAMLYGKSQVI